MFPHLVYAFPIFSTLKRKSFAEDSDTPDVGKGGTAKWMVWYQDLSSSQMLRYGALTCYREKIHFNWCWGEIQT